MHTLYKVSSILSEMDMRDTFFHSPYPVDMVDGLISENKNIPKTRPHQNLTPDENEKILVQQLIANIKTFLESSSDNFEKNMKSLIAARNNVNTFMETYKNRIERDPEGFEHVTEFFRTLFNYLDRFITWARGAEKTSAETYTPGAQTLKGRYHFLSKPETNLGTALKDFEHACDNLKLDLEADKDQDNNSV